MKKYGLTVFSLFTFVSLLCAQAPNLLQKQMLAFRIETSPKIDGTFDEMVWQTAQAADQFIMNKPQPGGIPTQKTEVKILYDNTALYIAAILYDEQPDSILNQLTERDDIGNSDWFAFILDTYRDGNNGLGFVVTPAGVQLDTKYSPSRENGGGRGGILWDGDRNWDAVWDAEAKITSEGWQVEMKIPYSAIRFPANEEQLWNINFVRQIRRNREEIYWNEVKPEIDGFLNQSGQIEGISNIKSPVRLSATPFLAFYGENFYDKNGDPQSSWARSFQGGMDIKYGLSDAFTLDMTLIPDFGQVQSDNEVLNLTPFEVRFDENRQFFTEGTELFNKGGFFYSRRVGGRPLYYGDAEDMLADGEDIIENPQESQLINASKISGRTKNGLGIGFFNAIAAKTEASIENIETGDRRKFETSPLTNYNVTVFDQNLKNNSYITLLNSNVWRQGDAYEANTTGTVFNLRNKAQSYSLSGKVAVSQKYHTDDTELGHVANFQFKKTSGNFQWQMGYNQESDTYDINDLGFMFNNNERNVWLGGEYQKFEPFGIFNRMSISGWAFYGRLYKPSVYNDFALNLRGFFQTRKFFTFGFRSRIEPFETYDYFEPRTDDFSIAYNFPTNYSFSPWFSTDFRKRFAMDGRIGIRKFDEDGRHEIDLSIEPRFRVNDKLSFVLELSQEIAHNDVGWVDEIDGVGSESIIFGIRDKVEWENVFVTTYTFSNKMSFSFRLRHYWAKAEFSAFKRLAPNGTLATTDYNEFSDQSFNHLTVDAVYRWRFAPGSDIFIVWKNNTSRFANEEDEGVVYSYGNSLSKLGEIPMINSLSIKVLYFLDYLTLKKK